jgi:hypothetical protein
MRSAKEDSSPNYLVDIVGIICEHKRPELFPIALEAAKLINGPAVNFAIKHLQDAGAHEEAAALTPWDLPGSSRRIH